MDYSVSLPCSSSSLSRDVFSSTWRASLSVKILRLITSTSYPNYANLYKKRLHRRSYVRHLRSYVRTHVNSLFKPLQLLSNLFFHHPLSNLALDRRLSNLALDRPVSWIGTLKSQSKHTSIKTRSWHVLFLLPWTAMWAPVLSQNLRDLDFTRCQMLWLRRFFPICVLRHRDPKILSKISKVSKKNGEAPKISKMIGAACCGSAYCSTLV
mmetsp:Transcript_41766/g.67755  ORF Transcript_41766/g.67755 Transcript_41766/m.67755 type:complete len:210 (+) Transcript_41766:489-1118(+)